MSANTRDDVERSRSYSRDPEELRERFHELEEKILDGNDLSKEEMREYFRESIHIYQKIALNASDLSISELATEHWIMYQDLTNAADIKRERENNSE